MGDPFTKPRVIHPNRTKTEKSFGVHFGISWLSSGSERRAEAAISPPDLEIMYLMSF